MDGVMNKFVLHFQVGNWEVNNCYVSILAPSKNDIHDKILDAYLSGDPFWTPLPYDSSFTVDYLFLDGEPMYDLWTLDEFFDAYLAEEN